MKTDRDRTEDKLRAQARSAAGLEFNLLARLPDLREYVQIAGAAMNEAALRRPPITDLPATEGQPLDFAKRAILLAVERFGMPLPMLKVRFCPLGPGHAGAVRERNGTWFVDLDRSLENEFEDMLSVAAHEVAHVALLRRRIRLEPTQRNEELTDTAAVLAGFGPVLIRTAFRERLTEKGNVLRLDSRRLGYLPARALVYLSTLRVEMAGGDAMFYREHVQEWQRNTVDTYIELRDDWIQTARAARGRRVDCFACGTPVQLPDIDSTLRLTCRVCRFPVVVPRVNA